MRLLAVPALPFAFVAAACGGDDGPGDVSPDAQEADTTPPTILSTSPADGASGQLADVEVVITFSEAMDQASVEGSLDTGDLGAVTLSWNTAGDTLTITPNAPLAYAEGTGDPDAIEAALYTVVLGNAAKDLAGNGLGPGISIGFTTLKRIGIVIDPVAAWSRVITPSGLLDLFDTTDPFAVGDTNGDVGVRSVTTFDLSQLPTGTHSIESAVYATRQQIGDAEGTPFTDLGSSVILDHVTYGELLDNNAVNAAYNSSQSALSTVGDLFVEDQVVVELDVSAQVADDFENLEARGYRSQFLARFETITDQDGAFDGAVFSRDLLELQISYLHP